MRRAFGDTQRVVMCGRGSSHNASLPGIRCYPSTVLVARSSHRRDAAMAFGGAIRDASSVWGVLYVRASEA